MSEQAEQPGEIGLPTERDAEYLMALRRTADHAFSCSCSDCEIVRREDANDPVSLTDETDPESPPWRCGDCGYGENRDGNCDWCGQLWEMA